MCTGAGSATDRKGDRVAQNIYTHSDADEKSKSSKRFPADTKLAAFAAHKILEKGIIPEINFLPNILNRCEIRNADQLVRIRQGLEASQRGLMIPVINSNFGIFATGSDAKHEKLDGRQSPVEFIVYQGEPQSGEAGPSEGPVDLAEDDMQGNFPEGSGDSFDTEAILMTITGFAKHSIWDRIDNEHIEFKRSCDNLLIASVNDKVIPSRILHLQFVAGDPSIRRNLYALFIKQLKALRGKEYKKFREDFVKVARDKLMNVIDRRYTIFPPVSFAAKEIKFNGKTYIRATKYCYLRAVQYTLDKVICDYIRKEDVPSDDALDLLMNLPSNTCDLIDYLNNFGVLQVYDTHHKLGPLTPDEVRDFKNAYTLALKYIYICQNLYSALGTQITLVLTEDQNKELEEAFIFTTRLLNRIP